MSAAPLEYRCWNHPGREAVCRCLACTHAFCRECVTEHHDRFLCAACLAAGARSVVPARGRWRKPVAAIAAAGGLLLAWTTFFSAAQMVAEVAARIEEQRWRTP
jgi:hypothetical protein